jgi:branched-chain amino acid transport system permease protein
MGVDVTRVRLAVFALSAALAGLAGALFAILNGYVNGDAFQAMKSIDFLIGAVVGGITSIAGALIGALFVVFVPEWAADANPAFAGLIYGFCLLAMTRIARNGVVGLAVTAAAWVWRQRDRATAQPLIGTAARERPLIRGRG